MFDLLMPLVAMALDVRLADPHGWPHPVRLLGAGADALERVGRRLPVPEYISGGVCTVLLAGGAWTCVSLLTAVPWIGAVAALYFAFAGLALGGLLAEGRKVLRLLESGDLAQAREALSMLVSRDTSEMDAEQVAKSLAETLSENLGDGFFAPLFYLCLLGPAGMWAYKAVSTLDSMWGYKTERYRAFGCAAARLDDILAWVPSRLAGGALYVCGRFLTRNRRVKPGDIAAHARLTESPNAGWPMAAAAWVCAAPVGGGAVYFGKWKDKPMLGPHSGRWTVARLRLLIRLVLVSGLSFGGGLWLLTALVRLLTVAA